MQVRTQLQRTIIMTLTDEEATWLHSLMQNPIHTYQDQTEDPQDARMRELFFKATAVRD